MILPKNPNWNHLKCFFEVGRELSMTKAAQALGITTPSVSAQIRALETACGAALLDRKTRSLEFTYEGQVLFDSIRKLFEGAERTFEQMARQKDFSLTVQLGLEPGWHGFYVQEVLSQVAWEHGGLMKFELRALPPGDSLAYEHVRESMDGWFQVFESKSEWSKIEGGVHLFTEDYFFCGAKKFLKDSMRKSKNLAYQMPLIFWAEESHFAKACLKALFGKDDSRLQVLKSDFPQFVLKTLQRQPCLGLLPLSVIKSTTYLEPLSWGKSFRREIGFASGKGGFHQDLVRSLKKGFARQRPQSPLPF